MKASTALLVMLPQVVISTLFLATLPSRARAADPRANALYWDHEAAAFVCQRVANTYVDGLPEKVQREAFFRALEAYVRLDPYCDFIPPERYKAWREDTAGEYGGLGIRIHPEKDGLRVTGVLPNGPASKAGLVPGDVILSADGRSLANLDPKADTPVKTLKGQAGVSMRLLVRSAAAPGTPAPAGAGKPAPTEPPSGLRPGGPGASPAGPEAAAPVPPTREVVVVRDVVRPPAVYVRRVGPRQGIGLIRVTEFSETTPDDFDAALNAFLAEGVEGLVLDLRDNSGGVLAGAVHVTDRFLSRGVIVRMEGRAPGANKVYDANPPKEGQHADVPDTLPLVVLVNGRSASASEVVSGALQDHRRALLVGERTFGKFLVQQITELPRGDCAVQLVTSRYYTPSGRSYQRHFRSGQPAPVPEGPDDAVPADDPAGLLPDIVQVLTKQEQEQVFRLWKNEEDRRWGSEPSFPDVPAVWVDPQLQRALEVLDGELVRRKIRQSGGATPR